MSQIFVDRGYPIKDSDGRIIEFFLGSRREAEKICLELNKIGIGNEKYHIEKSIPIYKINVETIKYD